MGVLAIDFGGTLTRAAWFDSKMRLIRRQQIASSVQDGQEMVIQRMIELARSVIPEGRNPSRIGISAPGPLDAENGIIYHARTLPGWGITPLAPRISDAFGGVKTVMQNDANLAAVAEYHHGAGKHANPMIYLTISTGIGGGAMVDGALFTGWRGMAIEPGHQQFVLPDGRIKRLEELASGTGLANLARERLSLDDTSSVLRDYAEVTGKNVGEAVLSGDALACEVIAEAGKWLGLGIVNLLHLFNPQAVVLGGSVTKLGDLLLDPVRAIIKERILDPAFYNDDLIRIAAFGDDVCLHGAALHAVHHHTL